MAMVRSAGGSRRWVRYRPATRISRDVVGGAVVPVFEGVLQELSAGSVINGLPVPSSVWVNVDGEPVRVGTTSSQVISTAATQGANMTHRQFMIIDGKRIMDVSIPNRHDALLVSSLGQRVRISAFKRGKGFTVVGVRLADGTVDKMGIWPTVFVQTANIALPVAFLVVVGVIGVFVNNLILALIAFGLAAIFVRMVVMGARRMSSARNEL